jgi:hypothetical protein
MLLKESAIRVHSTSVLIEVRGTDSPPEVFIAAALTPFSLDATFQ